MKRSMFRLVNTGHNSHPLDRPETGRGRACASTDRAMTNNSDIVFPAAARRAQAERGSAPAYEKRSAAGGHGREERGIDLGDEGRELRRHAIGEAENDRA